MKSDEEGNLSLVTFRVFKGEGLKITLLYKDIACNCSVNHRQMKDITEWYI